jgi:hypothetical protein
LFLDKNCVIKEFEPMMKQNTINDKDQMKIGKSDFVVEHRKSKLL